VSSSVLGRSFQLRLGEIIDYRQSVLNAPLTLDNF
jgi:hypothetical protein